MMRSLTRRSSRRNELGALSMANGGLTFLLLTFQYLVGW